MSLEIMCLKKLRLLWISTWIASSFIKFHIYGFHFLLSSVSSSQRPSFKAYVGRQRVDELLEQVDCILDGKTENRDARYRMEQEHKKDLLLYKELDQHVGNVFQATPSFTWTEWIYADNAQRSKLALITRGRALLDRKETKFLQMAATTYWRKMEDAKSSRGSRFTYQFKSNQEAHLLDLCRSSDELKEMVVSVLKERIYPLLMKEFNLSNPKLYDSLIIRYNATEAECPMGAGQPLHRDLALVSVNIMLNDDFKGGGTLFEDRMDHALKPSGVGHAILHGSHYRHAGVGTTSGVRDIWVLFVTSTSTRGKDKKVPRREQNARYKSMASKINDQYQKSMYYRMALDAVPSDGEAWHYMGMSLFNVGYKDFAQKCLCHATCLIRNDARLWNNLGLLLDIPSESEEAFVRSLEIYDRCKAAGLDVEDDRNQAILNFGLTVSNQDNFEHAVDILDKLTYRKGDKLSRVQKDALKLKEFCLTQLK